MKTFDIVAYIYKAEILCPACTAKRVAKNVDWTGNIVSGLLRLVRLEEETTEEYLDRVAGFFQVDDREDEWSFDSDDFPKVVFADMIENRVCDACNTHLMGSTVHVESRE